MAGAAVLIAFSGLATPAQAANAAPSAKSVEMEPDRLLPRVVVPTGGSAATPLGQLPASVTAVTIAFQGVGAWRNTTITASISGSARVTVGTAKKDDRAVRVLTLRVPANSDGMLTMWSSSASVQMRTKIIATTQGTSSAPTPTPTPAPASTPSGMPNAANTGVPAGTRLTVHYGDIRVTTPGTVIDGLDVHGRITVSAPNVTIKNSIVRGSDSGMTGSGGLITSSGFVNTVITDTELAASVKNGWVNGIIGNNFRATRLDIHDVIDAIHGTGDNVTVTSSWLHDNLHFSNDPNQGGTPSHDDSIQIQGGNNIVIDGNSISGAYNAGLQITQDRATVSNLRFTNNFADGGGCTINVAEKGRGAIRGIVITDNKFGRNTRVSDCAVIAPASTTSQMTVQRNYYVPDKTSVSVHRG